MDTPILGQNSMKKPLISIVMLNYNRPVLGGLVLESLEKQVSKNFEVILIDNGSNDSISQDIISNLSFPITTLRINKKLINLQLSAGLKIASGQIIMPFFADDDFLLPITTSVIEKVFTENPNIELLSLGTANLDLTNYNISKNCDDKEFYTGNVTGHSAREVALSYFSIWGLGEEKKSTLKVSGHPSGTVVTRGLIERTVKKQGDLYFGQFSDVSFLGLMFYTKHLYSIDLPLVLIGGNHPQDSSLMRNYYGEKRSAAEKKNRFNWDYLAEYLTFSPVKAITHFNLGLDNHIQVLKANNFDVSIPDDIRIDFYFNHMNEILRDDPWTDRSETDFNEALFHLENALKRQNVLSHNDILNQFVAIKNKHVDNLADKVNEEELVNEQVKEHEYDPSIIQVLLETINNEISSDLQITFIPPPKVIDYQILE